jgi:4-hydroxyphenylacetate 3-monooxygenase
MRRADDYLKSLKDGRNVWIDGKRVDSVAEHSALKATVKTVADLIESHHDSRFQDLLTEHDTSRGAFPRCYRIPESAEDLGGVGRVTEWLSTRTLGMMARLYNYAGATVLGLYENRESLASAGHPIVAVVTRFFEKFKWEFTQGTVAFSDPPSSRGESAEKRERLRIVEKKRDGIVVSGVKTLATGAPYADEILVLTLDLSLELAKNHPEFILAFFVEPKTPGLTLLGRKGLANASSAPGSSLAAFDEIDASLVFENVFIPNDRILAAGDLAIADRINSIEHEVNRHPTARRLETKYRLFWELSRLLVEAIGIRTNQRAQEAVNTIGRHHAVLSRLVRDAENHPLQRTTFPLGCRPDPLSLNLALHYGIENYPEVLRLLELLGGQSIVLIPTPDDLNSSEIGKHFERYMTPSNITPAGRSALMELAAEVTGSRFAHRQSLLEYYALGGLSWIETGLASQLQALGPGPKRTSFPIIESLLP